MREDGGTADCCVESSSQPTPPKRRTSRSSTFAGRCSASSNPSTSPATRCHPHRWHHDCRRYSRGWKHVCPATNVTQQQLRARSWWSGPDIYLVIDDYDLAAGATGNPLAPLADFLPHAKDLGLHIVVARRSGGAARAMFDPVLARMRELGCMGLMMSAAPDEGVLIGSVRPSPLPPGRGTLITRRDVDQLVQVAWTDPP